MPRRPFIKKTSLNRRRDKPAGIAEKVINILKILNLIEQGKAPSVKTLAEVCEVSERSIYRYLNILYNIVPVIYDPELGGYRLENERALRVIPLELNEIALLGDLMDFLGNASGELKRTFKNILDKLYTCTRDSATAEGQVYHFISPLGGDSVHLSTMAGAITGQMQLRIKYHAINSDEVTERLIDPFGLVYYDGLCFVYGYCHLREYFRLFGIDRITELEVLPTRFKRPEGFNLQSQFQDSWNIWEGEKRKVVVRFSKDIAKIITRKRWHPSEERRLLEDGSVELTFYVAGLEEIKWWLYSWIPYCEAKEPKELMTQMKRKLEQALRVYEDL